VPRLDIQPLHLGLGGHAVAQPPFTGMDWYEAYGARHGADGRDGRLVSQHDFSADWDMWEIHPSGDEVVICLAGSLTLHQDFADGTTVATSLVAGEYAINPAGCWHTADVAQTATALFITAGEGTQHRAR